MPIIEEKLKEYKNVKYFYKVKMKTKNFPLRESLKKGLLGILILLIINSVNAWDFVNVDYGSTNLYTRNSMEIKSNGNPCFVFVNNDSELFYECWNGMSFYDGEVIKNISGYLDFGLALDNNDEPHICLVTSDNVLSYYSLVDSVLNETNLSTSGTPTSCSIDTDKNNKPHIVYNSLATKYHYEIFLLGDTWTTTTVKHSSFPPIYKYPVIKLGTNDQKYVICGNHRGDPDDTDVLFANTTFESTTWGTTIIDTSFDPETIGDMALYNNRVYLSYETDDGFNFSVQDTIDSVNFSHPYSSATLLSLAVYQGVPYGVYSTGGNMYLLTNSTGSFQVTTEFGSVNTTHKPTLEIDLEGNKWILYTATGSDIVKLAYEKPQYTITGNIYNYVTSAIIENAYICYIKDSTSLCDYSNVSGGYEIDLFSDTYTVNITKSGYLDFSLPGVEVSESDIFSYYIIPEGYEEMAENESIVTLTFIDYDLRDFLTSEPFTFEYFEGYPCLMGLPPRIYTTNSFGQIKRTFIKGTYLLSSVSGYLFYDNSDRRFYNEFKIYVEDESYLRLFELRKLNDSYGVSGLVIDFVKPDEISIANATIVFYNNQYGFSTTSNEAGYYSITDMPLGSYNGVCIADNYLNSHFINYLIPCFCYGDVICNCVKNFFMVNATESTYYTNGTIFDLDNEKGIPSVKITVFSEGFETFKNTTTNSNGTYYLDNLTSGKYYMLLEKEGYEILCIDEWRCEEYGSKKVWRFPINNANYPYQNIPMINISQINYYCIYGNITWNNTPLKNALVSITPFFSIDSEGWFTEKYDFTNSSGSYRICGLREEYKFNIKIIKEGYIPTGDFFYMPNSNYTKNYKLIKKYLTAIMDFKTVSCDESKQPIPSIIRLYQNYINGSLINLIYEFSTDSEFGWIQGVEIITGDYWIDIKPLVSGYGNFTPKNLSIYTSEYKEYCLHRISDFYELLIWFTKAETDTPIFSVKVNLEEIDTKDTYVSYSSEISGSAYFFIPKGKYSIIASKEGYFDFIYELGGNKYLTFDSDTTLNIKLISDLDWEEIEVKKESTIIMALGILYDLAILPIIVIIVFLLTSLVFMVRDIFNPPQRREEY